MIDVDEITDAMLRSLLVSGSATLLAGAFSLVVALQMVKRPRVSRMLAPVLEALVGVPTVLIGLSLYMVLSKSGPLGFLNLLYTPAAIMMGEALLVTPLMSALMYRVLKSSYETYGELAISLGASEVQAWRIMISQALPGIAAAFVIGFSRAIGELGVALIVGGNIKGETRVLTTAIALEVSRGEFEDALAMGLIMVTLLVLISLSLRMLRRLQE